MRSPLIMYLGVGVSLAALACGGTEETPEQDATPAASMATPASMANAADTTGAAMWAHLQSSDYTENWQLWPEMEQLYAGTQPHGMLLTTYMNDVAYEAVMSHAGVMPAGAVIVKENYMPDSTLAAVTVMYKAAGYNGDHNDWFFTKHLPGGELDAMPNGMQMEGRLPGCQNCHIARADNDYLFTGSLSE